ncbi:prion-inhibition and propagation-domain-containing protein [Dactylonectria estremocensis]|uniref:Prion-inhibition and propagation-domain-containing protein n=1 Tax=Dactylonectria estremocensis TaxID=1079267 RepID=A0A9P9DM37_9HYPO|nr:prion-inhibition and propagation-domain-containing protein [Dactylonectria estremocensis]
MTEIFGIASGASSIASLFTTCVQCFGYVNAGKHCSRDVQTSLLRLSCAQLRLSRWGASAAIEYPDLANRGLSPVEIIQTKKNLLQILALFEHAAGLSERYRVAVPANGLMDTAPDISHSKVRNKLAQLAKQRLKSAGLLRKMSWTLHDAAELDKLIGGIVSLIESLEFLVKPLQGLSVKQLATTEVAEFQDDASLGILDEAADNVDPVLQACSRAAISASRVGHTYNNLRFQDNARGLAGDSFLSDWRGARPLGSSQVYGDAEARGESRMQLGNTYGGKGIFDD